MDFIINLFLFVIIFTEATFLVQCFLLVLLIIVLLIIILQCELIHSTHVNVTRPNVFLDYDSSLVLINLSMQKLQNKPAQHYG